MYLEKLAAQSLCTFCASRDDRRNVLFVAWKLKLNEVLSLRLRFFADQEMELLDMQEMRGREGVLVERVQMAEVKYEVEVRGYEVSKRTIQNLLGKVKQADLKYEGEVQKHGVSKSTIQELLVKLEMKDTKLSNQSVKFHEKTLRLSEEIHSLKEENQRLRDQRALMQQLWQRRYKYHNQKINSLNTVVKIFVTVQQKLTDQ
ncbi:hypothetical protein EAF04_009589 [Stromatinia cepivora]|nr:hypothetical protein EAF04_009589 [Stromatinia cepivora]